ncbi:PASTA domain-containing protein [Nocardioides halotolerans]|uniref:PASTA domain-containing protein n=1 Tax=Nocardioides halotolerans TaxID=433660 RepID=UPI0004205495|nr:PASTA domain-containing protein [Nocardioides halotolerans]
MDFDQYVAARYGRLVEHAVLLGCAEGEAGACVDRVLLEQRKQIRGADDPDPLVHEALESAISGTPPRSRRTGPLMAVGLVAVAVAVGAALTYRPPPQPVPSLFGLDATQAQRLLEDEGYAVLVRPARSCEPDGLVLGSEPPAGTLAREGATVTLRAAARSDAFCQAQFLARSDAWDYVAFALGGDPPPFAATVTLVVAGSEPRSFTRGEAGDGTRWGEAFDLVLAAARAAAPTASGMPALRVEATLPPEAWCGVARPPELGDRFALRLQIDPRASRAEGGCPLSVDLYRSERVIDTVVVYPARADGEGLVVDPA